MAKRQITDLERRQVIAAIKGEPIPQAADDEQEKEQKDMEENTENAVVEETADDGNEAQEIAPEPTQLDLAKAKLEAAEEELEGLKSPKELRDLLEGIGTPESQIDLIVGSAGVEYKAAQEKVELHRSIVNLYGSLQDAAESILPLLAGTDCSVTFTEKGYKVVHGTTAAIKGKRSSSGRGRRSSKGGWVVGSQVFGTAKDLLEKYPARDEDEEAWYNDSKRGRVRDYSTSAERVQRRLKEETGVQTGREIDFQSA